MIKVSLILLFLLSSSTIFSMEKKIEILLKQAIYKMDLKSCQELLPNITLSKVQKEYLLKQLSINLQLLSTSLKFYKKTYQFSKKAKKLALLLTILYSPLFLAKCNDTPPDNITTIKFVFYLSCFITILSLPIKLLCSLLYKNRALSYKKTNEILNLIKPIG